jgi:hypothetical protein
MPHFNFTMTGFPVSSVRNGFGFTGWRACREIERFALSTTLEQRFRRSGKLVLDLVWCGEVWCE